MTNTVEVVVAHFKENLEWLNDICDHCIVYDKGKCLCATSSKFKKVISIRNFGREGDTYLTYIIDNYPNFPDYVFFTQGNISDHVIPLDILTNKVTEIVSGTEKSIPRYIGFNTSVGVGGWGTIRGFRDIYHHPLPLKQMFDKVYDNPPEIFKCNYCGVFMVSKEAILFHSKKFYETLYDWMLINEPLAGYCLERIYTYVFDSGVKGRAEIENVPISRRKMLQKSSIL